ncbi:MBL fold metallo-hydrolase [Vibrio gigantis]|uniref:MBL fold metallo-hydrolase n=1 Tax=Vibrio gigantis TaxID=296199 RepID=UPI003D141159
MKLSIVSRALVSASLLMGAFAANAHVTEESSSDFHGVESHVTVNPNHSVLADFTDVSIEGVEHSLKQVDGNLYRHTSGNGLAVHSGFVLDTEEGVVVIDPAMTATAKWLNEEIKTRFGKKVKYVIYTHAHADHILGTNVFKEDGATIVANKRAIEPILGENLDAPVPDLVFDEEMTLKVGSEEIFLKRVAPSHSDSMTLVYFPKHKALQCTDICQSQTMPYSDFLDFYYTGWIDSLDWVIAQDIEVIDVGHYWLSNKENQVALRGYLVDLHQQVLDLNRQGYTWDQLWRNVKFSDEVKSWTGYDVMAFRNIVGMQRWVENHRRGNW